MGSGHTHHRKLLHHLLSRRQRHCRNERSHQRLRQERSIATAMNRMIQRSKAQTVHRSNWSSTHCEDVAEYSANSGGCSLERLYERRMIMRFDLERSTPTIAQINNPGVFTWWHHDALASSWESLKVYARRLVRAVFGPHDRKDAELIQSRFAAKQFVNSLEFFLSEIVGCDDFRSDHSIRSLVFGLCLGLGS